MHFLKSYNRNSKIYGQQIYNIPISNDFSHYGISSEKIEEGKVVYQKKQIQKIMHGIVKQRMFGNFIKDDTRISFDSFTIINQINKSTTNQRVRSDRFKSLNRTIQTSTNQKRKDFEKQLKTIDMSKTTGFFNPNTVSNREDKTRMKSKTFVKRISKDSENSFGLPVVSLERRTTTRELKGEKGKQILHHKKLILNEKCFSDFCKVLVGMPPYQSIYDIKITREMLYCRYKTVVNTKILQKFLYFFGFPSQFSFKQYKSLIQNAANANIRFIYFWVFVLLDQNRNGVLTYQDFFRIIDKFNENAYIESEIYELVRWLDRIRYENVPMEAPFQQSLTANQTLRLEELNQLMKQTPKERIQVDCVKNTCYHQTIISLQHDYMERQKINQIQDTEETTKKMKKEMMQRKKKLQNQRQLRLRDFYVIFKAKRPKIFCFFLQLLANVNAEDFQ